MSETPPTGLPEPGWYPDPADANGRRYWDGTAWTEHTVAGGSAAWGAPAQPAQPWQQPAGYSPYPGPAMPAGAYQAYVPQVQPLAPSGMRRIGELFSDAGRIIKRAWWPIIAVSLLLWLVWLVLVAIASFALVNVGNLVNAIQVWSDATTRYGSSRFPIEVRDQLADVWRDVPRTDSLAVWIVVGVAVFLLSVLVGCVQVAAVNRLAMDAATGQPVSMGAALRSGRTGGLRLFGYYWLIFVVVFVVVGLLTGVVVIAGSVAPLLGVLLGIAGVVGLTVLGVWLLGRLVPFTAQAVVGRGALRWAWEATRGKFWAVLGRYLLWALVASVIGQVVTSIIVFPFSILATAGASTGTTGTMAVTTGVLYLVSIALSMAVSAITYIGVVPIWRDLTDHPVYRSIGPDGMPVPHPA